MPFASCLEDALSISQSIYICYPGGQLGPNRQEVQFSAFRQTRFASYLQSIPWGNATCIWFSQSHQVCNSTMLLPDMAVCWQQTQSTRPPHNPMICTLDTAYVLVHKPCRHTCPHCNIRCSSWYHWFAKLPTPAAVIIEIQQAIYVHVQYWQAFVAAMMY